MIRAQVIRYGDIDKRFPERDPDSRKYEFKVLAEGDSWFTLGAVPSSNLLFNLAGDRNRLRWLPSPSRETPSYEWAIPGGCCSFDGSLRSRGSRTTGMRSCFPGAATTSSTLRPTC